MNIFLWILQVLLALHTLTGALWKFTNSSQSVPSLQALPHAAWIALSFVEILCALALILPALPALRKRWGRFVPIAALVIAAEMLLFCVLHLGSGVEDSGPVAYWLVTGALFGGLAYGRKRKPI